MSNKAEESQKQKKSGETESGPGAEPMNSAASSNPTGPESPARASLSAMQIEELQAKAARADEHWDRLLRLNADFDNFKKRAARERLDASRFANEALVQKLIPVLDNFEMALAAANQPQANSIESLKTGITMTLSLLRGVLIEAGLEEMDATNRAFDPAWQEAISQEESRDLPEGQVLQQIRKGYKFKDRLVRPASVVVAKKAGA